VFVRLIVHQSLNLSTNGRVVNPPTKFAGSEAPNSTVDASGEALNWKAITALGILPYSKRDFTNEVLPSESGPRPKVPSMPFFRPDSLAIPKNVKLATQL
jgi:hypothetical protein